MFLKVLEQTITFLCSFFCKKQENLLDFFRRCFLALVFLSGNFFVKATLRNWKKKKNCWMVTVTFFFCFLSSKASVRHSKVRFSFLKVFYRSTKTHGVWQALLMNIVLWPFVSCVFLVWANLFGKNSLPTTTTPSFCSIPCTKTISFWSKTNKKNFPHRQLIFAYLHFSAFFIFQKDIKKG